LKRIIYAGICISLALALSGCGKTAVLPDEIAKNEITTMKSVEKGKQTISIRAEYNVYNDAIKTALEKKFPDTNFVSVFHCSQETQYELRKSLEGGNAEDIIISPNMKSISDIAPNCLLDLSAESLSENYTGSSLEGCQIEGKLYYLPGPSSIYGIVYDKTMFNEHGWKVPHSYDEFISLVQTINASGIRAFQPTCKYARQAQLMFTMFAYDGIFGGVENFKWMNEYQSGKASMKGHIEPALERYKELGEYGIIKPEDFDLQPGNRSKMMYNDHSCAMIIETEQSELYAKQAKSDHEYGIFPFWCSNEPNGDNLMSLPNYYMGVNKKLGEKGNEKKLAKVKEILSYISTPEGQEAISGGKLTQISNVQNTKFETNDFMSEAEQTIKKGKLVPEAQFMAYGNNNPVEKKLIEDLKKYLEGSIDQETIISDCDSTRDKSLSAGINRGNLIGKSEQNFTSLETGLFIADAIKEKAEADIGLCLVGTVHCGMVGRIYKGDIYDADVKSLSLSVGVKNSDPNDKKLWLVEMSGKQLTELLKEGYTYNPSDNVPNIPYYVASGLKIKFAPWKEEKLQEVKTSDGKDIDQDKTYKVALWGWPFDTPCEGRVDKVFEDTSENIISQAIKKAGTIKPFDDGRFELEY